MYGLISHREREREIADAALCLLHAASQVTYQLNFDLRSLVNRAVTSIRRISLSNVVYDYGKFTLGPVLTHI